MKNINLSVTLFIGAVLFFVSALYIEIIHPNINQKIKEPQLSEEQISAIVDLLRSFGEKEDVIDRVENALRNS